MQPLPKRFDCPNPVKWLAHVARIIVAACMWFVLAVGQGFAVDPISVTRDDTALDLTGAVSVYNDRGQAFRVSTAPDAEGIIRTVEVQATQPETANNWAVFVLSNTSDQQLDRLIVAPHFRLVGSKFIWPDLGSPRIVSITPSSGFSLDDVSEGEADIFSITLDPGAVVTLVAELSSPTLPQVYLWEEAEYREIINSYTLYYGIVLGISGLLAMFLSILFVVRGTSTFPAAAALSWAVLAYAAIDFGFANQLRLISPEDLPIWRALSEAAIVATLALFLFTYLSLNRWNNHLRWGSIVWVAAMVLLSGLVVYDPAVAAGVARIAMALTAVFGLLIIIWLSLRSFDRAIMLIPAWVLLLAWVAAGYMTIKGDVDNDIIQPALAGGLVLIVLLIAFTVMQNAFSGGAFQQNLFSNSELQALAIKGSGDIVWDWDVTRDRLSTMPDLGRVIGLGSGALSGPAKTWLQHMHESDRDAFRTALDAVVENRRGRIDVDVRLRASDTRFDWINIRARPVTGSDGEVIRCIGRASNITDQKRTEERLLHDAVHDNLTGLPNRRLFFDRVGTAVNLAAMDKTIRPTVFIVDIDNFHDINELHGVHGGDSVLMVLARRLRLCLRPQDTLARLGGDQFGVLLLSETDPSAIATMADALKRAIKSSTSYGDREINPTASIGLATYTPERKTGTELFTDAEMALHQAKRFGGDRVEPFRPAFRDVHSNIVQLEADLNRAIERQEISMAYQPIVDVKTGDIAGFEALMRWTHPRRGEIPPAEFIGIAENSGLINTLGAYAIELACAELMEWDAALSDCPVFISVNVSAQQLEQRDFRSIISSTLARYPQRQHQLRLELTETSLMQDPEKSSRLLAEIRAFGVGLSIDDFGTGYSSLAYLAQMPFDTVKIDQAFVRQTGAKRVALLQSIINLAHSLDMTVITEGAELESDLELLRQLGSDYVQGYATRAAMSGADALAILRDQGQIVSTRDEAAQ